MKKRILSFLLALCMCLTLVPVTVLADDDVQQINDAAVQAITPGSDVSVLSVVKPDDAYYHTYEFYVDGEKIDTQIVKNGDTLYEPPVTAPAGKTFAGWNPKVTFGTVSNVDKTETITVNAQFDEGYHVYFKDPDGRIIVTKTGNTNDTISVADVNFPVGRDEAITGWYTDAAHTQKVESVTINGADITLYAKVEKGYWLTFESNGGSYVAPAFYAKDTGATPPTAPTKLGYAFDGWYTDEGLTMAANFGSIRESDTLYAKWTENGNTRYTVIHWLENADDDGYSYKASETKTGTTGGQTNATAKNYDGFTAQTITQETIAGDGSTIVSVKYKRNVYFVKFFTDRKGKNEDTSKRITAKYGANIRKQWPGGSWYVNKSGSTAQTCIDTMPLNGKNFYGKQQGTSSTGHYYIEVLPGQDYTETRGSKHYALDHSDFAPWGVTVSKEDRYNMTGFTCNEQYSAKNGWLYDGAQFFYDRNSYDLVFISGGKLDKTESVKYQASIAGYANYKPDTAPEGMEDYVFAGWYASQECTGKAYDFTGKTMPANNITLYAKWVAPTYTVTVYDQDGKKLDEIIVSKGDTVTDELSKLEAQLKLTLDTGDSFLGWTINRGLPFYPGTKITTNYELYAKVGNSTGYSVTYDANATGATGSVTDTEKYAKGAEATVKSNSGITPPANKVFLSWNTAADGTGKTYYPNSTVEITGNVTLYAQWGDKASTVSVTYHSNFAPDQTKSVAAVANNSKITVEAYNALSLPERTGYSFAGWNTQADGTGSTFAAGASARVDVKKPNDLYAQWTINQYNYTVNYYWNDKTTLLDSKTVNDQTFNASVTESPIAIDGYTPVSEDSKTITITTGANVINFYYYKNVELTANSDEATYDGEEHSVSGFTGAPADADFSAITVGAKGTNVGTYPASFAEGTVGTVDTTEKYIVTKANNGQLKINPVTDKVTVTIKGHKDTKTYDGKEHSVTGYDVTITGGNNQYTANDFSFSGTKTITGTNVADSKDMGLNAEQFANTNTNFTNVEFVVEEDGKLTIEKRNVTLTSGNASKQYDGTPLTKDEVKVTGDGFADGEGATYDVTGAITNVAENKPNNNTFTYTLSEGTTAGNYVIEIMYGTLEITPVAAEVTVTIKGHTTDAIYDATEKTAEGYDVISISNELYTANDFALTGKDKVTGIAAGEYDMGLAFENISKNFSKVTFVVEDGKLTIAKRDVTVTGESATKVYNGQTQEINGYTVDNLVKGHEMTGVTYSAKGKDPGKYDGSFTGSQIVIKDAAGTDVTKNYNVKPVIGVLTITQPSHPTRPSTPTKDVTSVKTADGSQMTLWMSMMLASAAGIVFLGKKRKEEQ